MWKIFDAKFAYKTTIVELILWFNAQNACQTNSFYFIFSAIEWIYDARTKFWNDKSQNMCIYIFSHAEINETDLERDEWQFALGFLDPHRLFGCDEQLFIECRVDKKHLNVNEWKTSFYRKI